MAGTRTFARSVAPLLGAALLFAACGDDGGSAGGGSAESWCATVALGAEGDAVMGGLFGGNAADVESGIKRMQAITDDLVKASPSEIAADVSFLDGYIDDVAGALAAADYVLLDVDVSVLSADEARLDQAQENLDDYTVRECGTPFGDDDRAEGADAGSVDPGDDGDDGDGFDPTDGTLREQIISQFEAIGLTASEATCIAENLDFNDPAVQSGDIASMLGFFEACGISINRLAELGQG